MPFANKNIAVVGLARSGLAAVEVLTLRGANVTLWDAKAEADLPDAVALAQRLGLTLLTGGDALDYALLDFVVTSPGVKKSADVLQNAVAAGVPVIGEIEAAYRLAVAPILAITGTNGKTTTTVLLAEMLRAAGIETFVAGNIAAGEIAMPLIRAAHLAPADAVIAAEISSFQLEWVSTFRPKVAALLNITPDHADRQTWDEYVASKFRIFAAQTEEDVAILPYGLGHEFETFVGNIPAFLWEVGAMLPDKYIIESEADNIIFDYSPIAFCDEFVDNKLCEVAEIKLPGLHNQINIMVAAAMASALPDSTEACTKIRLEHLRQVATTFTGVVHRLEYVTTKRGVKYVNNSMCTNADAFAKSLEALPEQKIVIMGGVFKGGDVNELAQSVTRNNVKAVILIGQSADLIETACHAAGFTATERAGSMTDAVTKAAEKATDGETVLLAPACASFDMFKDFEDRGRQFKEAVQALD